MKFRPVLGAFLLLIAPAVAQNPPSVAFPEVTGVPEPFLSSSGRFSSLSPAGRTACPNRRVTGRVVSARLIMVEEGFCGRGRSGNVLVNVLLADPAEAAQMVPGRRVTLAADFKDAEEARTPDIYANYLIAEKARIVSAAPQPMPAPAFTSYMICQPPELDAMAAKLGTEFCVQNTLLADLAAAAPALEAAARAPSAAPGGESGAIVCRPDTERSDLHLSALACARGSYWAWYDSKWRDYRFAAAAPP
jgi:hypothetical protein